jgi:hypothetical protein
VVAQVKDTVQLLLSPGTRFSQPSRIVFADMCVGACAHEPHVGSFAGLTRSNRRGSPLVCFISPLTCLPLLDSRADLYFRRVYEDLNHFHTPGEILRGDRTSNTPYFVSEAGCARISTRPAPLLLRRLCLA